MLNRREFLKLCRNLSIAVAGSTIFSDNMAWGFFNLTEANKPKVLFIQGQSCSGCTISMMYGNESHFIDFIMRVVRLQVHPALSFIEGDRYVNRMNEMIENKGYILVMEGSIPAVMKRACLIGETALYDLLKTASKNADMIISAGTCASNGGIPASGANEVGAISMAEFLEREQIRKPYVNIPGCPAHPDRLMGTVAYMAGTGKVPKLTEEQAPETYYKELIHNHCGRFQSFNEDHYSIDYEKDKGKCLLKKGCRGPITKSDCPSRRWNGGVNVCINSNTPCVGCIHPLWPFKKDMYLSAEKFEDINWHEMKKRIQLRG